MARYAGVSTAVVSYVMNDGPKPVAAATAARVRRAIEVLGYRPNLSARALRSGSTRMLALVVSDITNPFFADYALQVQAEAGSRGYAVLMANAHGDPAIESQIVDDLIDRQADGLILASVGVSPERAKSIRQFGLSTVVIDAATPVPGLASVGCDVAEGSRAVVEHLVTVHGHEQVAMVIGQGVPGADLREQGWLAATRAAGLPDGPIARRPFTREGGYQAAMHLLAARNPPRAIFTSSDLQAVGVLRAAPVVGPAGAAGCRRGRLRRHDGVRVHLTAADRRPAAGEGDGDVRGPHRALGDDSETSRTRRSRCRWSSASPAVALPPTCPSQPDRRCQS